MYIPFLILILLALAFYFYKKYSIQSEKSRLNLVKDNQIKFDVELARKYGPNESIVLGALLDRNYMIYVGGPTSEWFSFAGFNYPWKMGKKDNTAWIRLFDEELKTLFPYWEVEYSRGILNKLVQEKVIEMQEYENGTHYTFNKELIHSLTKRYS